MAEVLSPLEADRVYHIYNHAIGTDNFFDSDSDYIWFLNKFKKHILPVSEVLCYCLLPNHFHLVVRMKSEKEIKRYLGESIKGNMTVEELIKKNENYLSDGLSKQYSNFFNAYAKYCNYIRKRHGSLFKRAFRRKQVEGNDYLQQLICYIHQNPVQAGFCRSADEWKYSSFNAIVGKGPTLVCRNEVIELFFNLENFIFCNRKQVDLSFE